MFVYGSFQHFTDVFDHLPRGRSEELYIPQVGKFWSFLKSL